MEGSSPARLYATLVGGALVIVGIIGFFYSSAFNTQEADVDNAFGILAVNGWRNVVHIVTGALGLLAAGYAARTYALGLGAVYLVVAAWGFIVGDGGFILGFIPVNTEDNVLHLLLGLLGVGAGAATPAAAGPAAPAATEP